MAPFLSTSGITTFQDLISQAKKLERTNPKVLTNFQSTSRNDRDKSKRTEGVKYTATTFNVEKGKNVAEPHKPEQVKASALGITGNESRPLPSLKDRMNKKYSFKRDKVHKIFKDAVREGLQLPEYKSPEEQNKKDHPSYCPYHRVLGHTIEDCYVFKDWVERQYQEGKITLSKNVLSEQPAEHTRYVTTLNSQGSSQGEVIVVGNKVILPSTEDDKLSSIPEELWEVFISKRSMKMLKRLAELPGISWKRSQEPPKGPQQTKQSKKKNKKKKREQSKRKKSIIEEYIETLDEYEQKERVLITLKDYFPDEVKELLGELAKEVDENDEDVQVETCRVISGGEYPLYNPEDGDNDDYDSFSEPEESYDRYGRPYISKKQKKKIAFRERVKKANAKLLEPYQQTKPKEPYYTPKTPKYKVLRKVMPAEDIHSFIQRVTEESTNRLSQLDIEDAEWDGRYPPEISGQNFVSEIIDSSAPAKTANAKKISISQVVKIKKDKRRDLAIEKGLDLPRPKRSCLMHLDSHPNYCPYHRLVGHTIEECKKFQNWLQRHVSMGNLTLTEDYFEERGECCAIAVLDNSEDELNFPDEEEGIPQQVHQMQLRTGKTLQPRQASSSNDRNKGNASSSNDRNKGKILEEDNVSPKKPSKRPNYIIDHLRSTVFFGVWN
ncbi:hypothetical protein IHE45_02G037700 [Dioscorea alata]|uniref:Uncharacterized protein n=1 Tax=Dioscorea alata TaxID=55571 RepID=A0ACB7WQ43_DIOAL|nr:hypothetical protein IHE45_02G037700 [Dioscorea alata]